jgi:hypothetical protein
MTYGLARNTTLLATSSLEFKLIAQRNKSIGGSIDFLPWRHMLRWTDSSVQDMNLSSDLMCRLSTDFSLH